MRNKQVPAFPVKEVLLVNFCIPCHGGAAAGVEMFPLLLLFVVFLGGEAQTPCCFPPQWEAYVGILEGYYLPKTQNAGEVEGNDWVSYDYINKKLMSNLSLTTNNNNPIRGVVLVDFQKGMRYDIFGNNCTSTNFSGEMPKNCVPDDANFTGAAYFGAGNHRLVFNSFQFKYAGIPIFMTLTQEECIPVSETLIGSLDGDAGNVFGLAGLTYTGFTVGIKDPAVFEAPKDCTPSDKPATPGNSLGSIIGRKKRGLD